MLRWTRLSAVARREGKKKWTYNLLKPTAKATTDGQREPRCLVGRHQKVSLKLVWSMNRNLHRAVKTCKNEC